MGRDFDKIVKSAEFAVALAETDEEALKLLKNSNYSSLGLIGSPESLVSKIGEFVDAGVEYFQLYFTIGPNSEATQLFAEKVIPELS